MEGVFAVEETVQSIRLGRLVLKQGHGGSAGAVMVRKQQGRPFRMPRKKLVGQFAQGVAGVLGRQRRYFAFVDKDFVDFLSLGQGQRFQKGADDILFGKGTVYLQLNDFRVLKRGYLPSCRCHDVTRYMFWVVSVPCG